MQDRRKFIKSTCSLCAAAIGFGILLTEESCKPSAIFTTEANTEKVRIPLKLFGDRKTLVIKNPAMNPAILMVKKSENNFTALLMKCTHKGSDLELKPDQLSCPAHGSTFDFEGNVTRFPAMEPLTKFPVTVEGDQAVIHLKSS